LRVAVVALSSYNVLSADAALTHVGGAEVQVVSLGRALSRKGHDVRFITYDYGQPESVQSDGIRAHKAFRPDAGLRVLRVVSPRWSGLWRTLSQIDAEVCIQVPADCWTGIAATWCRRARRPFVFLSMSDADVDRNLPLIDSRSDRLLYRLGLRLADAVIVQTVKQRQMLRLHFGLESVVIPPCLSTRAADVTRATHQRQPGHELLWVGRFSPEKRLEWFLNLAVACPDLVCHVIDNANQPTSYADALLDRIRTIPNVRHHGFVPHAEISRFYDRATLLVSTSRLEGFPTIFLEAWARGLPVVSTFDPDNLVQKHRIGAVAADVPGLVAAVRGLTSSPEAWLSMSANAMAYFARCHSADAGAEAFEGVLREVLAGHNGVNSR